MSDEHKHRPIDETSDTGLHDRFHEKEQGADNAAEAQPAAMFEQFSVLEAPAQSPTPDAGSDARPKSGGGMAASVAWALALLVGGGALATWGLPRLAAALPAPLAAWIAPADDATAALKVEMANRFAEIDGRLAEATDAAANAASAAVARIEAVEAALAAAPQGDEGLTVVRAELAALAVRLDETAGAASGLGFDPATAAALAARIDAAVAAAEAARADAAALEARLAAMDDAEASREAALREAANAWRGAEMASALSRIDRAMTLGEPFAPALAALVEAAGEEAPEALARAAQSGAPTREALKASYADAAYAAISAMLEKEAEQDGGLLAGVAAKLQARVTGLPAEPIAGDSVAAVLSRGRASLLGGDIDATLAAISALPEPAQAAMAEWAAGAALRSEADAALSSWRNSLKLTL